MPSYTYIVLIITILSLVGTYLFELGKLKEQLSEILI